MEYITVKELFKITKGKKVEEIDYENENSIRYIQIDDLRNNNNIKHCENINKYVIAKKEDIIIAWDGANAGTIGFGIEGAIGSTLAILRKENKEMDTEFCGLFLRSKSAYLREKCTGATIPHIQRTALEDIKIPKISLNKQIEIKNIINKAQELIDKRKEQIEALDELVKSKFIEMFGDPITNPKGWNKAKLGDICTISRGGSPRPIDKFLGGPIPWIKIGDATKGDDIYLSKTKEGIIEEGVKKSKLIKKGGLIFANCGVSLGFARILKIDGCIHDGWLAFEKFEKYLDKIFFLKSLNYCTEYFRRTAPEGTQPNLNTSIMREYVQIVPPMELQQEFARFIEQVDKLKFEMEKSLKELEDNFNSLMQKAFKGELFN